MNKIVEQILFIYPVYPSHPVISIKEEQHGKDGKDKNKRLEMTVSKGEAESQLVNLSCLSFPSCYFYKRRTGWERWEG